MDNADVINFIRPSSQFTMTDNDLTTIVFHDDSVIPTNAEIEAGKKALTKKLADEAAQTAAAKSAILSKLGITEEEAKLLLS